MNTRTTQKKTTGAIIGAVIVFVAVLLGIGEAALVILGAAAGYTVGRLLDGEIDLERLQHGDLDQLRG